MDHRRRGPIRRHLVYRQHRHIVPNSYQSPFVARCEDHVGSRDCVHHLKMSPSLPFTNVTIDRVRRRAGTEPRLAQRPMLRSSKLHRLSTERAQLGRLVEKLSRPKKHERRTDRDGTAHYDTGVHRGSSPTSASGNGVFPSGGLCDHYGFT
jgi:hypothetical protein